MPRACFRRRQRRPINSSSKPKGGKICLQTGGASAANHNERLQGIRDTLAHLKGLPALNGPVTYTDEDHTGQNFESIGMGKLVKGVPGFKDIPQKVLTH